MRVLNFSRGALVDTDAMLAALADGTVAAYATDFPDDALFGVETSSRSRTLALPRRKARITAL